MIYERLFLPFFCRLLNHVILWRVVQSNMKPAELYMPFHRAGIKIDRSGNSSTVAVCFDSLIHPLHCIRCSWKHKCTRVPLRRVLWMAIVLFRSWLVFSAKHKQMCMDCWTFLNVICYVGKRCYCSHIIFLLECNWHLDQRNQATAPEPNQGARIIPTGWQYKIHVWWACAHERMRQMERRWRKEMEKGKIL